MLLGRELACIDFSHVPFRGRAFIDVADRAVARHGERSRSHLRVAASRQYMQKLNTFGCNYKFGLAQLPLSLSCVAPHFKVCSNYLLMR